MPAVSTRFGAIGDLRKHWPEYLMEPAAPGMFMAPASVFGVLLEHIPGVASRVLPALALAIVSAGQAYRHWRGAHCIFCAEYHHHNDERCIFRCNYGAINEQ